MKEIIVIIGVFQDTPNISKYDLTINGIEKGNFSKDRILKRIDEEINLTSIKKR
ncbi:hypothetical protein LCGC14_2723070 [marine sediment metagenome]|uniref:Uncharacterized protein n=1 Tax=marine sediment metagenome TaxID=412755 RepID=A0A0F8Z9H9_9ZZZZ